jgi:hypothetical protein
VDPETLKLETRAAFRRVAKPKREDIAPHVCLECDELETALDPYTSENLPDYVFAKHCWDLPLLSDEAKQYYLPAWILRSIETPQSDSTQALLYALESDHRWRPATPYTERQWRLLTAYLEFLGQRVDEFVIEDIAKAKRRLNREP